MCDLIERLLDNAATCSQERGMLDDGALRECVKLNVADPLQKEIERLTAELKEERAIVDRIWALFGTPSYEELKGRSIYDLISELQARVEALQGVYDAANEIEFGYPPSPKLAKALAATEPGG